jgi:hypothetical protein
MVEQLYSFKPSDEDDRKHWHKKRWKFCSNCPQADFYLDRLFTIYNRSSDEQAHREFREWEAGFPNAAARNESHEVTGHGNWSDNLILHGQRTGTGKTTVAYEHLWLDCNFIDDDEDPLMQNLPRAITGHAFACLTAKNARELADWVRQLVKPDLLLFDDLDKRGDKEGQFSDIVQQTLYAVIESRTTGAPHLRTIITMNATGERFEAKFGDSIGPYLMRRLRERFTSINFDGGQP